MQEGIDSLSGYGKVFYNNVMLSGAVPQISLICGPCAGGAAYSPALTDFIIQTRQAQMFITGPSVIKSVTGENVTSEQLGGPDAHMTNSGVIHFIAEDDNHAIALCQKLLSFLPANNLEDPPQAEGDPNIDPNPELDDIIPTNPKRGYDVRDVITRVVDFGDFLEVQSGYAMNIVVGFARLGGSPIGIIANQPAVQAGVLDINASNKASASSASAMPSTSRSSPLSTSPAFSRGCSRSTTGSSATAPSSCSPIPPPRCRKSP